MPPTSPTSARLFTLAAALGVTLAVSAGATACGSTNHTLPGFTPDGGGGADAYVGDTGSPMLGDSMGFAGDTSAVNANTLVIKPADPVVTVTVANGVVTSQPVAFQAIANGSSPVQAAWQIDRPDLGNMDPHSGVFTPSGLAAGVGHVTAQYGTLSATTSITLTVDSTENGGPVGGTDAGIGGVGGNGFGGPVSMGTQTVLTGPATAPTTAAQLGWLYPYDKTVWPRGLLPPLLQWQSSSYVVAVYIHLSQKYFDFKGFYSGIGVINQPIDPTAWTAATNSNTGDPLHVDLIVSDGTKAIGPISEDWTVASAPLQGTVYYDSYSTQLINNGQNAGILAIQPGAIQPTVAVPAGQNKCLVCHELSADGNTLFAEYPGPSTYTEGASYNLQSGGTQTANYASTLSPGGYGNDHKFVWSAVYPDGTFAMASSNYVREPYFGDSHLFDRTQGAPIPAMGWDGTITQAVMPAFSTDGKSLAFNFWTGTSVGGVAAGSGHNLVVMDFACGAPDGGLGCGAPPYVFSNMRQVYSDPTHYSAWPQFLPGAPWLIFHKVLQWDNRSWPGSDCTTTPTAGTTTNCTFATWNGAQGELWIVDVPDTSGTTTTPVALDQLNGKGYLPSAGGTNHTIDNVLNYEPTLNPIPSGGYYWVVFTSRRMYGNVLTGDPFSGSPSTKKLWVAAVDLHPAAGKDPSHPAFYLPGQELAGANQRGHWVPEPCRQDGMSCTTGDECCNGYCRPGDGGLVCTGQPTGCAQLYEHCTTASDCCGAAAGVQCINGYCTAPTPQ
jgi:hypothetical protein